MSMPFGTGVFIQGCKTRRPGCHKKTPVPFSIPSHRLGTPDSRPLGGGLRRHGLHRAAAGQVRPSTSYSRGRCAQIRLIRACLNWKILGIRQSVRARRREADTLGYSWSDSVDPPRTPDSSREVGFIRPSLRCAFNRKPRSLGPHRWMSITLTESHICA